MANIRLKFVKSYVDRHGKVRHYLRKPGCKAIPLPGLVGGDEFMRAYGEAVAGTSSFPQTEIGATRTRADSINAMVVGFLGSAQFARLASTSQGQYRRILELFRRQYGDLGIATLQRKHVVTMLDGKAAKTPTAARDLLRCLKLIVKYSISIGVTDSDPTAGVRVKLAKIRGIPHVVGRRHCRLRARLSGRLETATGIGATARHRHAHGRCRPPWPWSCPHWRHQHRAAKDRRRR